MLNDEFAGYEQGATLLVTLLICETARDAAGICDDDKMFFSLEKEEVSSIPRNFALTMIGIEFSCGRETNGILKTL
jgi:hypothetical protein